MLVRGVLRLVAQVVSVVQADRVTVVISARQQPVVLIGVILAIVIVFIFSHGLVLLLAEEAGRQDFARRDAIDDQVEEADEGHHDRQRRIDRVLRIKEQKCNKDHEESLPVQEAEELEVLEHSLHL